MVALKAELGAVVPGVPGVSGPSWPVFVAGGADALPGTGTDLGTFEHYSSTDPMGKHGPSHLAWHHIRDLVARRMLSTPATTTPPAQAVPPASMYTGPAPNSMWPYGIHDMSILKPTRHGAILNATGITAADVTMAVAATATLAVKLQPGDVASAAADNDFVSANRAIATVATTTGVVTGVAPGTTVIRIVNKYNFHRTEANVTVTGALMMMAASQQANENEPEGDVRLAKLAKSNGDEDNDNNKKKSKK